MSIPIYPVAAVRVTNDDRISAIGQYLRRSAPTVPDEVSCEVLADIVGRAVGVGLAGVKSQGAGDGDAGESGY